MNQQLVSLFWTLAEGCTKHMAYHGRKEPTGDCPTCRAVWYARMQLIELAPPAAITADVEGRYVGPVDQRCMFCGMAEVHSVEQHHRSLADLRR